MQLNLKTGTVKLILAGAGAFCAVDFIYRMINKVSYVNRDQCILYKSLPRFWFLAFEYFIELSLMILLGIYFAALAEKLFTRFKRFYPGNPLVAFIYGSILPVCACATIPVVETMKEKMNMNTLITFIIAAPILNPYIIFVSFAVLGPKYAILRIVSSLVVSVSTGYVIGAISRRSAALDMSEFKCVSDKCTMRETDVYAKTISIFTSILPYVIGAGVIGIVLEFLTSKSVDIVMKVGSSFWGRLAVIATGIPFYFCNGTDVLLLRPFIDSGVSLGTAVAFSITATSLCITSVVMLMKFLSKRIAVYLILYVFVLSVFISILIDALLP
jgi:uncharacterized membrane protein YraQ (UPF0718 family)